VGARREFATESEGTREEETLSFRGGSTEDGARCVRSPRNALFCRESVREKERGDTDKGEREREGREGDERRVALSCMWKWWRRDRSQVAAVASVASLSSSAA